jgi:hypothetical protein
VAYSFAHFFVLLLFTFTYVNLEGQR